MQRASEKAFGNGDMPGDIDVDALAAFVNAIVRGLAVQARDGASRSKLRNIGRVAIEGMAGQAEHGRRISRPRSRSTHGRWVVPDDERGTAQALADGEASGSGIRSMFMRS